MRKPFKPIIFLLAVSFLMAHAHAKQPAKNEIPVTLFGQNCTLEGPYTKDVLKMIHEISPEKLPPTLSTDQMKKIRQKISKLKPTHPAIDTYKDHLSKRLAAMIAFSENIKGTQNLEIFIKNVKEHVLDLQFESFKQEAKKISDKSKGKWDESFKQELKLKYDTVIQPDTEEEFHRAARQANLQYICNFDEGESDEEN